MYTYTRRCWAAMLKRSEKLGLPLYAPWCDFDEFLADVGPAPYRGATLSRIDHTKSYRPSNVQWESKRDNFMRPSSKPGGHAPSDETRLRRIVELEGPPPGPSK